jgi:hypothetical protein
MRGIIRIFEEFFWSAFWIFFILIVGFAVLSFLNNKFSGNIVGNAADWVEKRAMGGKS